MRKPWYRTLTAVAATALIALGLAACGSSTKASTTATTTGSPTTVGAAASSATTAAGGASSATTATPAGSPLLIGFECSCSGALASSTAIQLNIIKGWAAYENANGGIAGHPVKLIVGDDALNPGTSLTQVTKMVENNHVVAIIDGSDVDTSWGTFVAQHNVPVIGDALDSTLMFSSPDFFPEGQTIDTLAASVAAAAKRDGVTVLGLVYCSSDPVCAELAKPVQAAAKAIGIKAPFASAIPDSAPNYTAPCVAAKEAGVNGIFAAESSTVVLSFVSSCSAQGYTPKYLAEDGAVASSWLTSAGLQGLVSIENNLPAEDTSNPAVQTMTAALNKYEPGTVSSPDYGPGATGVWASGMLLAAAAQAGNIGATPTSADLLAGLYSLKSETIGGLSPPLTFQKGKPTSVDCWFYLGIQNHKFSSPYGTGSFCGSGTASS
jgi:branched-chain amino acid transport system substrate-binding protein